MRGVCCRHDTVATLPACGGELRGTIRACVGLASATVFHEPRRPWGVRAGPTTIAALQGGRRDGSGFGQPRSALPSDLGGVVDHEVAMGRLPSARADRFAGAKSPAHRIRKAAYQTRAFDGAAVLCCDGERDVHAGVRRIAAAWNRDAAFSFSKIFQTLGVGACLADTRLALDRPHRAGLLSDLTHTGASSLPPAWEWRFIKSSY